MRITNEILEEIIIFVTQKHRGQTRKGNGFPYIIHPLRVMNYLLEAKERSTNINLLIAAALLHDVVEDCGVTLEEIARRFGYQVAALVEELTSDKERIAQVGKAQYLLEKMLGMSTYALTIKLCDRIDNIVDSKNMKEEFRRKYKAETLFILEGLKKRKLTRTHKFLIRKLNNALNKIK
jgi:guanosine-3',5'-bis(diphosphate) 3'-pyrophosphohydrolase